MRKRIVFGSVIVALLMLVGAMLIATMPHGKSIEPQYAQPKLKPDLMVWSLDVDTLGGGNYRLNVVIKNVGNLSAGPFYDSIWWDDKYKLCNDIYHSGLGVLQTDSYHVDFLAQRGLHKITVITDYYEQVDEWDDLNNDDKIWYYYWWL